jgi:tetratricopeptide (TPR) repeat protein
VTSPNHPIVLPDAPADQQQLLAAGGVACWEAPLTIDTYEPAEPDRYPLFLDRRVYQGSSGKVYPIPFTDRIESEKAPREWRAIHLENRWVRLVLLPELGGRIHIGYDKSADYDFFYRNNVIKPALVGLAGPWISGGVEFNWPQHHRPATYLPVETRIERADDGSVTVWHSDLDQLQRMRGSHGIRLRGDSTLIELDAQLVNRTDVPQTFLWWANVAARSHEHYQSFFPTDVRYVADHARRAITAFPNADRPYYGVDYPALAAERADADRIDVYSNIPVPTSYMITDTADDFFGGYDHDARAGFVHWADRAIAPGKKQWTWGDGEVGHAWDRHLTDGDGPYVELMAGVFTDNQPDFSWLQPGETREFRQYWYPIREIGPAVQATLAAAISVEIATGEADASAEAAAPVAFGGSAAGRSVRIGVATTAVHDAVEVVARRGDEVVGSWTAAVGPEHPLTVTLDLADPATRDDLVVVATAAGRTLVEWRAHEAPAGEPWVATEPPAAAEIEGADELVLTGLHLVQYRHPTRAAEPYFAEAIRRDPGDSRARIALARLAYDRGELNVALDHLDRALERLTRRNLNPERGDAHLLRGLVLERLGREREAADAFGKAGWDGTLALPAALGRARLALRAGDAERSLQFADAALAADPGSSQACAARIVALRAIAGQGGPGTGATRAALHAASARSDRPDRRVPQDMAQSEESGAVLADEASALAERELAAARAADPLDPLLAALDDALDPIDARTLVTMAHELHRMGDPVRGLALARRATEAVPGPFGNPVPLAHYAVAAFLAADGDAAGAAEARAAARAADPRLAFPSGLDDLGVLEAAVLADPADARAEGYLGCWLLDAGRTADALAALDSAIAGGDHAMTDPVVWRNAAVALVNTGGDPAEADRRYGVALRMSPGDARLVYERDQLAALREVPAAERLAAIEAAGAEVLVRDDLAISYANLLVDVDRAQDALDFLDRRAFQPFEGGEGQVIAVFDRASAAVARELLAGGDAASAIALLEGGIRVPEHLGEGRHPAVVTAERFVLLGNAYAAIGDRPAAEAAWRRARDGGGPLAAGEHVVDARDAWTGIAHTLLGETEAAARVWDALDARADALEAAADAVDYFATSLPELLLFRVDTAERRAAEARELRTLAAAGRTQAEEAA